MFIVKQNLCNGACGIYLHAEQVPRPLSSLQDSIEDSMLNLPPNGYESSSIEGDNSSRNLPSLYSESNDSEYNASDESDDGTNSRDSTGYDCEQNFDSVTHRVERLHGNGDELVLLESEYEVGIVNGTIHFMLIFYRFSRKFLAFMCLCIVLFIVTHLLVCTDHF